MKTNYAKILVKAIFVLILPILSTVSVVYCLREYGDSQIESYFPWILAGCVVLLTYVNAIFYLALMSKTKILPTITGQFMPIVGLGIAFDQDSSYDGGYKWIVILPFYSIEFKRKAVNSL
tara:strand:- start:147 stop:506 length:360 start_codon:yes stop_codon:yes gene_type:complete